MTAHLEPAMAVGPCCLTRNRGPNGGHVLPNPKRWSEKSNEFTRKTLANGESGLLGDVLHFKHIEGSFGLVDTSDILRGAIKLLDKRTMRETVFASVEELISEGWTVD
jgi:hypothetical protein